MNNYIRVLREMIARSNYYSRRSAIDEAKADYLFEVGDLWKSRYYRYEKEKFADISTTIISMVEQEKDYLERMGYHVYTDQISDSVTFNEEGPKFGIRYRYAMMLDIMEDVK